MEAAAPICCLPVPPGKPGPYKWPSLEEAYRLVCFGFPPPGPAHDAWYDVEKLQRLYLGLRERYEQDTKGLTL
jgi:hypothetical protein